MRVIGFLTSLVLVAVGSWARLHYGSIVRQIKGGQECVDGTQFGPFDDVFYDSGTEFSCEFGFGSSDSENTYQSRPPVSSGVQSNPYID